MSAQPKNKPQGRIIKNLTNCNPTESPRPRARSCSASCSRMKCMKPGRGSKMGAHMCKGGGRTHPGDSFSWRSCIFQCPFRPFLLGKCCTGPPQGPQRDSSGGWGHCCPTWPTQLHRSCEQAGMTCSRLLEQNNLRSSCGRPGDHKRTRKFRQGGMVRDLSPSPTLLGPLGGKTRSLPGTREAVQGSPSCLAQKPFCWENK